MTLISIFQKQEGSWLCFVCEVRRGLIRRIVQRSDILVKTLGIENEAIESRKRVTAATANA